MYAWSIFMKIRYIEPLSRAIERSTQICFRPFDIGKWFVLGFACWLARLRGSMNRIRNQTIPRPSQMRELMSSMREPSLEHRLRGLWPGTGVGRGSQGGSELERTTL